MAKILKLRPLEEEELENVESFVRSHDASTMAVMLTSDYCRRSSSAMGLLFLRPKPLDSLNAASTDRHVTLIDFAG